MNELEYTGHSRQTIKNVKHLLMCNKKHDLVVLRLYICFYLDKPCNFFKFLLC